MRTFAILLACALVLQAEPKPEQISWDKSAEELANRRVVVELTSGERLEGKWVKVTASAFTLQTRKGQVTNSRTALSSIRADSGHIRGRVIGVLAGYAGTAGVAGAATQSREATQGSWGIAVIGVAVAGYFVGRSYDKALHDVNLVP